MHTIHPEQLRLKSPSLKVLESPKGHHVQRLVGFPRSGEESRCRFGVPAHQYNLQGFLGDASLDQLYGTAKATVSVLKLVV